MKQRTFLLVNPYVYDFSAYDLWSKPLGLLYIAAILEENGCRVVLLDAMDRWMPEVLTLQNRQIPRSRKYGIGNFYREKVSRPEIFENIPRYYSRYGATPCILQTRLERIAKEQVIDMVLVTSGMTYWYRGVCEVIGLCKEIFPNTPVALGGIYATLCTKHARQNSGADMVFKGEGESALLKILAKFRIKPQKTYSCYDDYPFPAYHLYPRLDYVAMSTSRGCPFQCSFCASRQFVPEFHPRRPENVVEEIEYHLTQRKISDIAFYDDALFVKADRHIKPILRQVIAKNLQARFHTPNGLFARMLDNELAELLAESGFRTIRLSYESKNPRRQQQMGKVKDRDLEKALENLERAGFSRSDITVYLLMGLPYQSRSEIEQSYTYVNSLGAKISLSSFSPIPGTPEWQIAVEQLQFPTDDPLYGNKSVYPLKNADFNYRDFDELKKTVVMLNQQLRKCSRNERKSRKAFRI